MNIPGRLVATAEWVDRDHEYGYVPVLTWDGHEVWHGPGLEYNAEYAIEQAEDHAVAMLKKVFGD